ncbi:hypothetical protein PPACK8108_LOCUS25739 [Phakopsora pachyrhizi]|uniref:Uncharacterized protein n=1 Tax=Phakopsora pachyrhizi TaxID=170000 RepID=A0AAV0ALT9_PHAPC|nr:hypothetical protein PPACK8108_LOCUS2896 [Phakopsora pachyrhizi]CAH7677101.1 hypothetical protein PPACK8108_LOCUS12231 [Phakopsora pachyrhizi]CAH7683770.1 hypothetical protein PPACK8108_LOCUS17476 [Phakopsora pachyrhizi]CAH7685253.1 hypothetical protein PPACK8108_LOCUS19743 [Phakopsora pachyrhizi]CAH7690398.1 hypothetical protein PPACK8108_LOCUS25739 [Phakopsora pachyrhizi]
MTLTRSRLVVCSCQSYGCKNFRYKNKEGGWNSGGSLVSWKTRKIHTIADAKVALLLEQSHEKRQDDLSSTLGENLDSKETEASSDLDIGVNLQCISLSQCSSPNCSENVNTYDCRECMHIDLFNRRSSKANNEIVL